MKNGLLILFVICAAAVAIPRNRRALPSEASEPKKPIESTPKPGPTICDASTPCGWEIYNPINRHTETFIRNQYCICDADTNCQKYEDEPSVSSYIFRCLKPGTGLPDEHS